MASDSYLQAIEAPTEAEMKALRDYGTEFYDRWRRLKNGDKSFLRSSSRLHSVHPSLQDEFQSRLTQSTLGAVLKPWDPEMDLLCEGLAPQNEYSEASSGTHAVPQVCTNIHMIYPRDAKSRSGSETNLPKDAIAALYHPFERNWDIFEKDMRRQNQQDVGLIQKKCCSAGLRSCSARRCQAWRELLDPILPRCPEWNQFRRWALIAGSCHLAAVAIGAQWHETFTPAAFNSVILPEMVYSFEAPEHPFLLFQVREVILCWKIQLGMHVSQHPEPSRGQLEPSRKETMLVRRRLMAAVIEASTIAADLHICPFRLWNLAKGGEWDESLFLTLMNMAKDAVSPRSFAHAHHGECSAEFCQFSDEKGFLKQQRHKCEEKLCDGVVELDLQVLEDIVRANLPTAWPIQSLQGSSNLKASLPKNYIAISHVWSDGTGVGIRGPGSINKCLIDYFIDIAYELDCDGIWWDTICIPLEQEARGIAISQMHKNYEQAAYTVVHDQYLVQFPWTEDGSPALAIILSPWFTRGWTALELSVSKIVKVIFRDAADPGKWVIKDLDQDILAGKFSTLGHYLASTMIKWLRGRPESVAELLKILSMRTTSWTRDRSTIAALLARVPDFDHGDPETETTSKILRAYQKIPESFLRHGHVTLSKAGGFSWCPASVFTLPRPVDLIGPNENTLDIDDAGAVCGTWTCVPLDHVPLAEQDKKNLRPHANHITTEMRVRQALEDPSYCMLLSPEPEQDVVGMFDGGNKPVVLVNTAGLGSGEDGSPCIDCHYVGCVERETSRQYWNSSLFTRPRFSNQNPAKNIHKLPFRIGCRAEKPVSRVEDVIKDFQANAKNSEVAIETENGSSTQQDVVVGGAENMALPPSSSPRGFWNVMHHILHRRGS